MQGRKLFKENVNGGRVTSTAHRGFMLPKVTNDATGASLSKGVSHSWNAAQGVQVCAARPRFHVHL